MSSHNRAIIFVVTMLAALLSLSTSYSRALAADGELSAKEIVNRSFKIHGGDDSISTLTFTFMEPGDRERKLAYTMLWKDYKGRDDIITKMIFFKEFPPADKGIAYMTWMYRPDLQRDDDEWLYLPELRTVRKLSKKIGEDEEHDEDSDFSKSVLHRPQLVPRPPALDTHELLRTEVLDGKEYYVVARTPKQDEDEYPYSQTINWISKDHFLLSKIDYYNKSGSLVLQQRINWQQIDDAWVWDRVEAVNRNNGNKTVLTVSDVRVNTGLDDDTFTKRVMKLGIGSLRLAD